MKECLYTDVLAIDGTRRKSYYRRAKRCRGVHAGWSKWCVKAGTRSTRTGTGTGTGTGGYRSSLPESCGSA